MVLCRMPHESKIVITCINGRSIPAIPNDNQYKIYGKHNICVLYSFCGMTKIRFRDISIFFIFLGVGGSAVLNSPLSVKPGAMFTRNSTTQDTHCHKSP